MPTKMPTVRWRSLEESEAAMAGVKAACGRESGRPCALRGAVGPTEPGEWAARQQQSLPGAQMTLSSLFSTELFRGHSDTRGEHVWIPPSSSAP